MVAACLEHRLRRIRGEIPGIISGPGFLCIDEPEDKMMTAAVGGSCQEKDVRTISKKISGKIKQRIDQLIGRKM